MLFRSLITYVYNFFVKIWTAKVGNYWFTTKNPGCFPGFNVLYCHQACQSLHWRGCTRERAAGVGLYLTEFQLQRQLLSA